LFRVEKLQTIRGTGSRFRPAENPALTIRLGETTTVSLVLYTVTARPGLPLGVKMETNWNMSAVASKTEDVAGQQVLEPLKESGDGTWTAEDLPAGDYTLEAAITNSASTDEIPKPLLEAKTVFTVPGNLPGGILDLGEIQLQPVQ
jgi:hypothetical protein